MRLGIIIAAHRAPSQVRQLVRVLQHDNVSLYLHVDSRVQSAPFVTAGVTLLPRYPTLWGGPELIDALLAGIHRAVSDNCDYIILLTGESFPLKPIEEIIAFFGANPRRSYGEYGPLVGRSRTDFYAYTVRGRRELCIPWGEDTSMLEFKGRALNWALRLRSLPKGKRGFPSYLEPYGGRVWWNLSREAAAYVLEFVHDHPDYRRYHQFTWCPDEIFFCSILAASGLDLVSSALRYYRWGDTARSLAVTSADIPAMLDSDALFAQKVAPPTLALLEELVLPAGAPGTNSETSYRLDTR